MIEFMNGLAVIVAAAQMPSFQRCDSAELFADSTVDEREWHTVAGDPWHYTLISQGPQDWQDYPCITLGSLGWYSD
jgi:hypothetical protein